ncbi:MAG: DUF3108 domain-containing protein [Candidatus Pseudothioglobus sp.]
MKKTLIFILTFLSSLQIYALTAYEGSYDLYAKTKMGNLKIGTASLVLEVNENHFVFNTEATTGSLWKVLYDYSRFEKSIGDETDGQIINTHFSVIERVKDEVKKNYEIQIITDKNYALSSTGEGWKVKPGLLVDPLSVYLALSNDIRKKPDQLEFTYQVVDQVGVKYLKFLVDGFESININENEIETVKVYCEELQLTLNLSLHDNLQPVTIRKINGKNEFIMILKEFSSSS